jgi:hypothetical protein
LSWNHKHPTIAGTPSSFGCGYAALWNGKVAICASDLQMYVNQTTFQNLSIKGVASMFGVLGGKIIRVPPRMGRARSWTNPRW